MLSAQDLLPRWPALDVPASRARLQQALQLTAGPLDALDANADAAQRALAWRRDPSLRTPRSLRCT